MICCLISHFFGSDDTNSAAIGLGLDCCQATHQHFPAHELATLCRSTRYRRPASLYRVHLSVCFHLLCNQ